MVKHFHIDIKGKVNQLGYKLHTMILANKYTILGNISEWNNLIEIEAEGEETNLKVFIASCKEKLKGTKIDEIIIDEKPLAYYDEFTIL